MGGFGDSYGISWYGIETYGGTSPITRTLVGKISVRIVKAPFPPPPIMDTLARGLAQRFDWLQQGIQAFGLFNKIEYMTGQQLDDHFGRIYELPRLTGESDVFYRLRLKTYLKVLTGCGTIPAAQEVLDIITGVPGGSIVSSRWPAQALVRFTTTAIREAKLKENVINSVLPGMFAAGITYDMRIPYAEGAITATIQGLRTLYSSIGAAIATESELTGKIDVLIAYGRGLDSIISAAIQGEPVLYGGIRSAIRSDRLLYGGCSATIQGEPALESILTAAIMTSRELTGLQTATIQGEPALEGALTAAVARQFELTNRLLTRIVLVFELNNKLTATIRTQRELTGKLRVRIAKRISS